MLDPYSSPFCKKEPSKEPRIVSLQEPLKDPRLQVLTSTAWGLASGLQDFRVLGLVVSV